MTALEKPDNNHIVASSPTLRVIAACTCDGGIRYTADGTAYPCPHCKAGAALLPSFHRAEFGETVAEAEALGITVAPMPPAFDATRHSMAVRVLERALTYMKHANTDAVSLAIDDALTLHVDNFGGQLAVAIEQYEAVGIRESIDFLANWLSTDLLDDALKEIKYLLNIIQ